VTPRGVRGPSESGGGWSPGWRRGGAGEALRLSEAEALGRAAAEVERLHRLYLRTLKALQELRRARPPVIVGRAEQVSIGQQQVNVAR
jgi:hypothetical protein